MTFKDFICKAEEIAPKDVSLSADVEYWHFAHDGERRLTWKVWLSDGVFTRAEGRTAEECLERFEAALTGKEPPMDMLDLDAVGTPGEAP